MNLVQKVGLWLLERGDYSKYNDNDPTRGLKTIWSGSVGRTSVTEETALSLSAFWSGVRLLSESVAGLPLHLIQKRGENRVKVDHYSLPLLNSEAASTVSAFDYHSVLVASAIVHGNGYAVISREGSNIELVNVHPDDVTPVKWDGEIFYKLKIQNKEVIVLAGDMIHLKGFGLHPYYGYSAIQYHRLNIGLALAAQDYGADFYNKGTRIDGYLKYPGKLDKDTKDAIAEQWINNYGANGNRGVALLDGDTEYKYIGMPPNDAQFIETRKFQKNEIATILRVPAHMVNELENATFSNIEHQGIEYLNYSLKTWLVKLEQEYRIKLLTTSQRVDHQYKFNTNALLRTDVEKRSAYYETMLRTGVFSINDVRALEDLNPIEGGGDTHFIELNKINVNDIDNYHAKNSKDGNAQSE